MTDRLTPEREVEIAARNEAATPGPWGSHRDLNAAYTIQARPRTTRNGMENDGIIATLPTDRTDAENYANARFIAHAREDVEALLAENAHLREERDEAREQCTEQEQQHAFAREEARGRLAQADKAYAQLLADRNRLRSELNAIRRPHPNTPKGPQ
ncbi:hypothetical protein ACN6LI_003362 [Streptomyces violaceoruber]